MDWLEFERGNVPEEFKDLSVLPGVVVDLRYASENNFVGRNMYGEFKTPYLHKVAFEKLKKANKILQARHPGYNFLILDALRPGRVQRILFDKVKGTEQEPYVADPARGSLHSFGFAIDLTLIDKNGNEVDMGTQFDDFTDLAQPKFEEKFLAEKLLTSQQIANRKILREAMVAGGFRTIPNEWWHFNALHGEEVRKNYRIVE
jgi:D-alanyl-D-alanine dipeptidase